MYLHCTHGREINQHLADACKRPPNGLGVSRAPVEKMNSQPTVTCDAHDRIEHRIVVGVNLQVILTTCLCLSKTDSEDMSHRWDSRCLLRADNQ